MLRLFQPNQNAIINILQNPPINIFRAYDIRGKTDEHLTDNFSYLIGRAFANELFDVGGNLVVIGRDCRNSSLGLLNATAQGLIDSGHIVIDIGEVPTPVLYFATNHLECDAGIMITGSHNPKDYNGLKMSLMGKPFYGQQILKLKDHILKQEYKDGAGKYMKKEVVNDYVADLMKNIYPTKRKLKVVIDCGNGMAGDLAPKIASNLNHEVVKLFCNIDGNFPNHHPDPSKLENLSELIETVKKEKADVGLAYDGDADRLGVVDSQGRVIWPDRQLILFAKYILKECPGASIIYDVKCTGSLPAEIKKNGGEPYICRTGHSFIKEMMLSKKAQLGGEMSGHIFFKNRWYGFDDAIYAGARMLEMLSSQEDSIGFFNDVLSGHSTPEINIELEEGEAQSLVEKTMLNLKSIKGKVVTVDGIRIEETDAWGLMRASNTTPSLVLRFEGDTVESLKQIQQTFKNLIMISKPNIVLPF